MNLYDILMADNIVESINENLDYLLQIIPEIKYMIGFDHKHPHHHLDVWKHTLLALSNSQQIFDVRLTLLLHDIGKPFSYQTDGEIRHYKGHPEKSKIMAYEILKRLGYEEKYIEKICFYIENHDTEIKDELIKNNIKEALTLFEVQQCDALAHHPDKLEKRISYLTRTKKRLGI